MLAVAAGDLLFACAAGQAHARMTLRALEILILLAIAPADFELRVFRAPLGGFIQESLVFLTAFVDVAGEGAENHIDVAREGNVNEQQRGGDVADPWYSRDFGAAFRDIYDGCAGLLESF